MVNERVKNLYIKFVGSQDFIIVQLTQIQKLINQVQLANKSPRRKNGRNRKKIRTPSEESYENPEVNPFNDDDDEHINQADSKRASDFNGGVNDKKKHPLNLVQM